MVEAQPPTTQGCVSRVSYRIFMLGGGGDPCTLFWDSIKACVQNRSYANHTLLGGSGGMPPPPPQKISEKIAALRLNLLAAD